MPERLGHVELHLRRREATGGAHLGVDHPGHMEHNIIIMVVALMPMQEPIGRLVVYLHVAHPQFAANLHLGVEEVGARVAVVQARVDHLHRLSVGGVERSERKHLVLPTVVQQLFHVGEVRGLCRLLPGLLVAHDLDGLLDDVVLLVDDLEVFAHVPQVAGHKGLELCA